MDTKHIDQIINRYFEGETTLDEERLLRRLLADESLQSESAHEARAVMGYLAAAKPRRKAQPTSSRWLAAACIGAVAVGVAFVALKPQPVADTQLMADGAYINGKRVDAEAAIRQMQAQMLMFDEAAEAMDESVMADMLMFSDALGD